jgi:hypothetical protein
MNAASRITEFSKSVCSLPTHTTETPQLSDESLDVFEVALCDTDAEQPFYVVPYKLLAAEEFESEHDAYACWRVIPDPTGNKWEDFDGVQYALVPEQGTLYVRQRDLLRKVSEVFACEVKEQSVEYVTEGIMPHRFSKREFFGEVLAVKESFMAMYFRD